MFLTTNYGENIREFLTSGIRIKQIVDFGDLNVFADALTYVSIFVFNKNTPNDFDYYEVPNLEKPLSDIKFNRIKINDLSKDSWNLKHYVFKDIFNKINLNPKFTDLNISCNYGVVTGLDDILAFKSIDLIPPIEKECLIPFLRANKCERYTYTEPTEYIVYPYKNINEKTVLLTEVELKQEFPLLNKYLLSNKKN